MFLDAQLSFCDSQAITAAAGSTNTLDNGPLKGAFRDLGAGENLYVMVNVNVAFTDSGSDSSLQVNLEGDSTTTFTPDGTDILGTIPAVAAAGSIYFYRLSPGLASMQFQYLRLKFTPNNGNLTTGTVSAKIVKDAQLFTAYKDAIINIG